MKYYHVDVFSRMPYSGNGLTIFIPPERLEKSVMEAITREMHQFESIFLHQTGPNAFRAYIFTMEEELAFRASSNRSRCFASRLIFKRRSRIAGQ
jgi:predicted PhzF superfamily epimerase YddE/YHI9